ncbi:hypothetical protein BDV96DRAFT_646170 [Lophiotrema nucula]|uniref:F-box domain-containing protein n=1 Tax=Lophiotrema nucula TaxID=690887 RepID=A0A6A5Z9P9_9PLEO|nr:hypothetical protein BDV96DRAFT_646170 [Lophiotrema nucula]
MPRPNPAQRDPANKQQRQRKRQIQKQTVNARQSRQPVVPGTKLILNSTNDWKPEELSASRVIKYIEFGPSAHLDALAALDEAFRHRIEKSGIGALGSRSANPISDDAVARLASACPNLKVLRLDAATSLTGTCLPTIFRSCPALTTLAITGSRSELGRLQLDNVRVLNADESLRDTVPKLKLFNVRRAIGLETPDESYEQPYTILRALTAMESRKKKLEVLYEHPWAGWTHTYKSGKQKQERERGITIAQLAALDAILSSAEPSRDPDSDSYSMTKSELSAIVHRA